MSEEIAELALTEFIDHAQFKKDLDFDLTDLTTAMQRHAGLYSYYASQAIRAKRQHEIQVKKLEILEAALDREYRIMLKEENPKTTEPQIKSAVLTDRRYAAMSMREINARSIYDLARSCERSFDQQKDMLLQIARDASKEREGSLRVVANQSAKERLLSAMEANAAK